MEATLTLHQAGSQLGVEDTVLSRLIRIGALPEAHKVHRPDGDVWVIPTEALAAVATRNGWTIDLRHDEPRVEPPQIPTGSSLLEPLVPTPSVGGPTPIGEPSHGERSLHPDATAQAETTVEAETAPTTEAQPKIEVQPMTETQPAAQTSATGEDLGALVPHQPTSPDSAAEPTGELSDDPVPSMAEVVDLALLDRLLEVQEERITAQVESRETKHALAALNETHNRTTGELEIERRERMVTSDRYREERMARAIADAKVAELRDRVVREMALAEAEKQARSEALARSIRAERDAANAMALMSRRARRKFRKLSAERD